MPYIQHQGEIDVLVDLLNGCYTLPIGPEGVEVGGLELVFSEPVGSVTFPETGSALSAKEVRDAINSENIAGLTVRTRQHNGGVSLVFASAAGIVIEPGSANEAFGLPSGGVTKAPIDQENIALFTNTSHSAQYILVINYP